VGRKLRWRRLQTSCIPGGPFPTKQPKSSLSETPFGPFRLLFGCFVCLSYDRTFVGMGLPECRTSIDVLYVHVRAYVRTFTDFETPAYIRVQTCAHSISRRTPITISILREISNAAPRGTAQPQRRPAPRRPPPPRPRPEEAAIAGCTATRVACTSGSVVDCIGTAIGNVRGTATPGGTVTRMPRAS